MKLKLKAYFLIIVIIVSVASIVHYRHDFSAQLFLQETMSPQELVAKQLAVTPLSGQSVWNQEFLKHHPVIKDKILKYEKGDLCKSLKVLDNKKLTHKQLLNSLKGPKFQCVVRPLTVNPLSRPLSYLKTDNTSTSNPKEKGVAHQEICWDQAQPACVIRLKRDGFPLNRRSAPHSTKAVLIDGGGDPSSYDNEAFKIGSQGQAIPKGPSVKFGLRKCPYNKDKESCDRWVDAIMEEAHPALKDPQGTNDGF